MRKKVFLSLTLALAAITGYAGPISHKQAAQNVYNFLNVHNMMKASQRSITLSSSTPSAIQPYYIFNIGNNEGYVIASGDDAAYAILGYSHTGHLDVTDIPDNMRAWLDEYAHELTRLQKLNLPAKSLEKNQKASKRNIPAMLSSQWAQENPYNNFTPDFNDGYGHRPTGCVATAIAQVMKFHRWPEAATAKVPRYEFEDTYSGGDGKVKQVEALDPIVFDWDAMLNTYNEDTNDRSKDAVANLMNYVGRSVKMVYGPYSSGAFATDMAPALINIFGYKNTATLLEKHYKQSQEEWNDIIYNELANNRPVVYYGATNTTIRLGHQFICDGYENGFFHINWGWAGRSDGFFRLTELAPEDQGTGGAGDGMCFSETHKAIIGLERPVITDRFYANSDMTSPKNDIIVCIRFDNASENFVSAEFDLTLPQGFTLKEKGNTFAAQMEALRSENEDHVIKVSKTSETVFHISISSPTSSRIIVKSGILARLTLIPTTEPQQDTYQATLSKVILKNKSQGQTSLKDCTFNISFYQEKVRTYGDANKDGQVNRDDVQCMINYIMYKNPKPFEFSLADSNKDGYIDIADVMNVLDLVLENSQQDRHIVATEIDQTDALSFSLADNALQLSLTNNTGYKAIQMDISLPAGHKLKEINPGSERMQGFKAEFKNIAGSLYRLLIYSPESQNIAGQSGTLAAFITNKIPEKAKTSKIMLITSDLQKITLPDFEYKASTGINEITTTQLYNIIYTIDGLQIKGEPKDLPKGIYIVNGKKRIIE